MAFNTCCRLQNALNKGGFVKDSRLNERGLIAWPLKLTGKINAQDRDLLLRAWTLFAVEEPGLSGLNDLETQHDIDGEDVAALMQRLHTWSQFQHAVEAP